MLQPTLNSKQKEKSIMMRTDKVLIFLPFEQSENGDLRSSAIVTTAILERRGCL